MGNDSCKHDDVLKAVGTDNHLSLQIYFFWKTLFQIRQSEVLSLAFS